MKIGGCGIGRNVLINEVYEKSKIILCVIDSSNQHLLFNLFFIESSSDKQVLQTSTKASVTQPF